MARTTRSCRPGRGVGVFLLILVAGCAESAPAGPGPVAPQRPKPSAETLIAASKSGDVAAVKRQLDDGADPNALTKWGEFALLGAATNRHPEVVRLLLERGADLKLRDGQGQTALFMAAYQRDAATVKLLIGAGAEPDATTSAGETALLRAVIWQDREVVGLLRAAGASPDAVSDAVLAGIRVQRPRRVEQARSGGDRGRALNRSRVGAVGMLVKTRASISGAEYKETSERGLAVSLPDS